MAERSSLHWRSSKTWSYWPSKTALASANGPHLVLLLLLKSVSPLQLPISSSFAYASQRFCGLRPSPCSRLRGEIWNRCYWCPIQIPLANWFTHLAAPEGSAASSLHTWCSKNCPGLMEADSPETLGRLTHPSPLTFNDWLIQESWSPDLLLQVGTTLLCELYSRSALNQNKSWCHLRSHCCLVLPFPVLPYPHSLGDIFLQSIPSIHHVHPNPFSVSDSKEPELRQILTEPDEEN